MFRDKLIEFRRTMVHPKPSKQESCVYRFVGSRRMSETLPRDICVDFIDVRGTELPRLEASRDGDDELCRLPTCALSMVVHFSEENRGNAVLPAFRFGCASAFSSASN